MKNLIVIFVLIFWSACLTPRRAAPPASVERDTVYIFRTDTLVRNFPLFVADTVFAIDMANKIVDSIKLTLGNQHVKTEIEIVRDIVWRIRLKTQVLPDTIYRERVDTIFLERVIEAAPAVAVPADGSFPWELLVALGGALLLFFAARRVKKKE